MDIKNGNNESVGQIEISSEIMDTEVNGHVLHQVVLLHLANRRSGTSSTKSRAEVRGSGRKLFRQKGTGMARMGMRRTPLRIGGGVAFGPKPRDFSYKVPKKVKLIAIKSALADKFKNDKVVVIDSLNLEHPKTKDLLGIIRRLGFQKEEKTMIVLDTWNENILLSARNIPGLNIQLCDNLNTYDILWHNRLLFTQNALQKVQERYFNSQPIQSES
ncbi:50S ribosomal protein L4 [Candidatus Poribacteria bacterium]|nr:50S ribosomal protein L4 [Candidatus Poribacteria bacterium]